MVECSYQCGAHLPRRLMDEHQRDECSQRSVDVRLESFMKRMEERHEREIRKMKEEHKREMAELKVTIISSTYYVVTTPPQDEYTIKLAETLERVRKIEEETIPQLRGDIALQLLYNIHATAIIVFM